MPRKASPRRVGGGDLAGGSAFPAVNDAPQRPLSPLPHDASLTVQTGPARLARDLTSRARLRDDVTWRSASRGFVFMEGKEGRGGAPLLGKQKPRPQRRTMIGRTWVQSTAGNSALSNTPACSLPSGHRGSSQAGMGRCRASPQGPFKGGQKQSLPSRGRRGRAFPQGPFEGGKRGRPSPQWPYWGSGETDSPQGPFKG